MHKTDIEFSAGAFTDQGNPTEGPQAVNDVLLWRLRNAFRFVAIILAIAETYVARNVISPDGRSYLDLARAYLRHDWAMTVNAYWNPLYAWLLTLIFGIAHPSMRWEYPVAHGLNLLIFLVCIAAFEYFWSGVISCCRESSLPVKSHGLSPITLWMLGYSYFIWLTVGILLSVINPDLCVMTLVLLIGGILLRLHTSQEAASKSYLLLGFVLGVSYLAKSIMFPAGFLFLLASLRTWRSKNWVNTGLAAVVFLGIAAPQIMLLSRAQGHLTFSTAGTLNSAWFNYDVPLRNWQGHDGNGTPVHPTREIHRNPDVFEFNGPIRATYPPRQDPSYWNAGLQPPFSLVQVAHHTEARVIRLVVFLATPRYWLAGMLLILLGADFSTMLKGVARFWYLIVPAVAVLVMYSLTWVEFRYLPPWLLLLWAAFLLGVRLRGPLADTWVFRGLAGLLAALLLLAIAYGTYGQFRHGREDDATPEYETAQGLRNLGLREGAKVGSIGFDSDVHWAYLARFFVIAEMDRDQECAFWSAPVNVRRDVLEAFSRAGAQAVIANGGGGVKSTGGLSPSALQQCSQLQDGWERIPGSPNLVYIFR